MARDGKALRLGSTGHGVWRSVGRRLFHRPHDGRYHRIQTPAFLHCRAWRAIPSAHDASCSKRSRGRAGRSSPAPDHDRGGAGNGVWTGLRSFGCSGLADGGTVLMAVPCRTVVLGGHWRWVLESDNLPD